MKIAILSDIHDNLPNLEKCLAWCRDNGVEKIVCPGDVTNSETLGVLAKGFSGEIFLVRGNAEIFSESELAAYPNIAYGGEMKVFEIAGRKVGACHEPQEVRRLLEGGRPDIVFYGHAHKPWIDDIGGVKTVNPGTLGGVFSLATFAVWETDKGELELKVLDKI